MGKEAKIGLTVIGALAITLVAVLVMRLVKPGEPPMAAGTAENQETMASPIPPPAPRPESSGPTAAVPAPVGAPYRWNAATAESEPRAGEVSVSSSSQPTTDPAEAIQVGPYAPPPSLAPIEIAEDPYQRARRSSSGANNLATPPPAPSPPSPGAAYTPPQPPSAGGEEPSYSSSSYSSSSSAAEPRPESSDFRDRYGRDSVTSYAPPGRSNYEPAPVSPGMARSSDPVDRGAPDPFSSHPGVGDVAGAGRQANGTYVVRPNENFWTISERLYGTGAYFKALAEYNRASHHDQDRLRVGDSIAAPGQSELEQRYPDLCPSPERRDAIRHRATVMNTSGGSFSTGRIYTVQEGDTLYDIARFELGKGSRWAEIYDLNRNVLKDDFDYLTPGMKLSLPNDSRDAMTRRPDQTSPF